MTDSKYVIIGGGMTAAAAVKGIRDEDATGPITIIGDDVTTSSMTFPADSVTSTSTTLPSAFTGNVRPTDTGSAGMPPSDPLRHPTDPDSPPPADCPPA